MKLLTMMRMVALTAVVLVAVGCFPEIEELCKDAAINECQRCYSCALADGPSGGQLCGVEFEDPVDEDSCIKKIADRCSNQASTLDQPKSYINQCIESQATDSCEAKLGLDALNQPVATNRCAYLF